MSWPREGADGVAPWACTAEQLPAPHRAVEGWFGHGEVFVVFLSDDTGPDGDPVWYFGEDRPPAEPPFFWRPLAPRSVAAAAAGGGS